MGAGTDLTRLLGSMSPVIRAGIHVFVTLPAGSSVPNALDPLLMFREREGMTLVVAEAVAARAGLDAAFRCRMITLSVHSPLEAVGFLAAVTGRLAAAGIPANPVSAFHHDHLFVPADRAEEAVLVLDALAAEHRD